MKQITTLLIAAVIFQSCVKNKINDTPKVPAAIRSINPTSGPYNTVDTIFGTGFTSSDMVTYNGVAADITHVSDDTLIVVVPKRAGTGPVIIKNGNDTLTGPVFTYIYTTTVTTLA